MLNAAAEARRQRCWDCSGPGQLVDDRPRLPVRHHLHPFCHATAADEPGLEHRVDAELGLHAFHDAAGGVGGGAVGPQFADGFWGGEFERFQDETCNFTGTAAGQPAVELPAHPVGGRGLGECFAGAPDAFDAGAVAKFGRHFQPQAVPPRFFQPFVQAGGQCTGGERCSINSVDRVLRSDRHREVLHGNFGRDPAIRCGRGDAVDEHPGLAETRGDSRRGQRRQLPERGNPQLPQRPHRVHVRAERFFGDEHTEWLVCQERRRLPLRHHVR